MTIKLEIIVAGLVWPIEVEVSAPGGDDFTWYVMLQNGESMGSYCLTPVVEQALDEAIYRELENNDAES